jgi:hypothetical protein
MLLYAHLKQISDVPLFSNHVVVRLTATNLRRFTMNENLFDDESHSSEAVGITILPDRVVVNFMNTIYQAYLKENSCLAT